MPFSSICFISFFKRYNVSGKLEEGILIVGKQNDRSVDLTYSEKQALLVFYPHSEQTRIMIHKRLLVHNILFSSSSYQRQLSTCDYVMYFDDGCVGYVTKYISLCLESCLSCSTPCTHLVIAKAFPVVQHNLVDDTITGAKAAHVHCFAFSPLYMRPVTCSSCSDKPTVWNN